MIEHLSKANVCCSLAKIVKYTNSSPVPRLKLGVIQNNYNSEQLSNGKQNWSDQQCNYLYTPLSHFQLYMIKGVEVFFTNM